MFQRLAGVFGLSDEAFESIRISPDATWQAAAIVTLVGLFAGLSSLVLTLLLDLGSGTLNTVLGFIERLAGFDLFRTPDFDTGGAFFKGFLGTFAAWLIWTLVALVIGLLLARDRARFIELLRVIGYGQAPRLLSLLGVIPLPFFGLVMGALGWLWAILATASGIKQTLGLDNGIVALITLLSLIAVFSFNHWLLGPLIASFL
jgi:hypothetical protein